MIDFEIPETLAAQNTTLQSVAESMMRPVSRQFDDQEHAVPWDYIRFMHTAMRATGSGSMAPGGART